ncbi:MAG TPA: ribonuclease P protein component [Segetibacter sp.]
MNNISITTKLTYNKTEKLKSRKQIEHLFDRGKSFSVFPIKVLYDFVENSDFNLQAGVTVSSRNFKKAVSRNRVKRVLREAYRLEKMPLQNMLREQEKSMILFFIYIGKELPVFAEVHGKMQIALQRLQDNILNKSPKN